MNQAVVALAGSALPTLMGPTGILLNRNDINRLDARITALEVSLRAEMAARRTELRGEMNSLRGEMNSMRDRFHNDMMMVMSSNAAMNFRLEA